METRIISGIVIPRYCLVSKFCSRRVWIGQVILPSEYRIYRLPAAISS